MTIKELKEKLENFDENLEVFIIDCEWGAEPVDKVSYSETNGYNGNECVKIEY